MSLINFKSVSASGTCTELNSSRYSGYYILIGFCCKAGNQFRNCCVLRIGSNLATIRIMNGKPSVSAINRVNKALNASGNIAPSI